jgi:signal transduction histidine kinase
MDDVRAVREQELRRAIERSLHDGVQQQLVALGVKLQLADLEHPELHAVFEELRQDVHDALDAVRRLAWEIYPALLLDHGVVAALRASGLQVEADADVRYPRDVEAAVYFACLGVSGSEVAVRLAEADGALRVDVRVDGSVLEPVPGVVDRIGAVGGETTFTPSSLRFVIPLPRGTG